MTVSLGTSPASEGVRYISIENFRGSGHADRLTSDGNANELEGGAGADVLDGGAGADTAAYDESAQAVTVNLGTTLLRRGDRPVAPTGPLMLPEDPPP